MAASASARHETRALLRAHLAAASSYRHLTRHCPVCHHLLRLVMDGAPPTTAPGTLNLPGRPNVPGSPNLSCRPNVPDAPEAPAKVLEAPDALEGLEALEDESPSTA
ncbi:DUF6274 family protein [Streptomyces sp. NPDC020801]|uniref:DUF6274 family protein n=1 Tax=unclassified Streptomyces TaxID=2593676 RepID=UPI0037AB75E7